MPLAIVSTFFNVQSCLIVRMNRADDVKAGLTKIISKSFIYNADSATIRNLARLKLVSACNNWARSNNVKMLAHA
jgi:hypothetical protein